MQQKCLLAKYEQRLDVLDHSVHRVRIERCIIVTGLELDASQQVVIQRLDLVKVEVAEALKPVGYKEPCQRLLYRGGVSHVAYVKGSGGSASCKQSAY